MSNQKYCLVQNGVVVSGPRELPVSYGNVSNLNAMNDDELKTVGWLPYVLNAPTPNPLMIESTAREISDMAVTDTITLYPDPNPPALLMAYRNAAISRVNTEAGECRAKYITVIPGQSETYLLKNTEAQLYNTAVAAGNTPVPEDYPICLAEAQACNMSLADVIYLVSTTANQWKVLAAQVEGLRRGALVKISNFTTAADIDSIFPIAWP